MKNSPGSRVPCPGVAAVAVMLTVLAAINLSAASFYPQQADKYVNDFASTLTMTDRTTLGVMLRRLETQTGIKMGLATIKSIADYPTGDADIDSFATNLFNEWEMGKEKEGKGVLILIAVKDRKMKIELGGGYGPAYDVIMQQVIDGSMIPYFKEGDYSRGIYEGTRAAIERVTKRASFTESYLPHMLAGLLVLLLLAGIYFSRRGKASKTKEPAQRKSPPATASIFGGGAVGGW
jgi:uncharacterized protein